MSLQASYPPAGASREFSNTKWGCHYLEACLVLFLVLAQQPFFWESPSSPLWSGGHGRSSEDSQVPLSSSQWSRTHTSPYRLS